MARKFYIAYGSLTAVALLAGIIGFTVYNKAHAQTVMPVSTMRCFVGARADRPDTHVTRGWVCVQERAPVVIN
jgi:hypothetical protein